MDIRDFIRNQGWSTSSLAKLTLGDLVEVDGDGNWVFDLDKLRLLAGQGVSQKQMDDLRMFAIVALRAQNGLRLEPIKAGRCGPRNPSKCLCLASCYPSFFLSPFAPLCLDPPCDFKVGKCSWSLMVKCTTGCGWRTCCTWKVKAWTQPGRCYHARPVPEKGCRALPQQFLESDQHEKGSKMCTLHPTPYTLQSTTNIPTDAIYSLHPSPIFLAWHHTGGRGNDEGHGY